MPEFAVPRACSQPPSRSRCALPRLEA